MKPKISIIIPVYNCERHIEKTLISIKNQSLKNFEIIVVDDHSKDKSGLIAKKFTSKVITNERNLGPAISRNKGIKSAKGDIIAFIDSDCIATKNWISNIIESFKDKEVDAIMGKTRIPKSNFIGDSISSLGFPGGANVGFEKMWHVDKKGYTDHITSCNFAAKNKVFKKYGLFDESFPLAGGEDPELSYRWSKKGVKIKYSPLVLIYHEPRTKIISFIKWMIYRGRSNYHFKKKVGNVNNFLRLRLWSSKNIIKKFKFSLKIFLIVPLLFLSFILQNLGYLLESMKK